MLDVSVIILCGGLGSRLQQVSCGRPKALIKIMERSFIDFQLDVLVGNDVSSVILATGYGSEMIESHVGDEYRGMRIKYSCEEQALGTGGAVRQAVYSREVAQNILIMNGDTLLDLDMVSFVEEHIKRTAKCSLVLSRPLEDDGSFGSVSVDKDGYLLSFNEKSHSNDWVNAGVYCIDRDSFLAESPDQAMFSLEHDIFPVWVTRREVFGYRTKKVFHDIGTEDRLRKTESFLDAHMKELL